MDHITQVKKQYRQEQWAQLIQDCQHSGLPVRTWCNQNGVKEQSYYYWLRKIRKAACEELLPLVQSEKEKTVAFTSLPVSSPSLNSEIIIHLPFATIEVQDGTSKHTLETVLKALKELC